MPVLLEATVVALRRSHRTWGPARIVWQLEREGATSLPSRSAVCRALLRHDLLEGKKRRRKLVDYRRWERGRSIELWQTLRHRCGLRAVRGRVG